MSVLYFEVFVNVFICIYFFLKKGEMYYQANILHDLIE